MQIKTIARIPVAIVGAIGVVSYIREFVPAFREALSAPVEITPIPSPELIAFMQKLQFCSMGLMTGFGNNDHCYLPPGPITAGAPMIVCARHIDDARRLGVIENELTLS